MNCGILPRLFILAFFTAMAASAQNSLSWHDPSPHKVQFVSVPDGSMGRSKNSPAIFRAYGEGAQKRDYSRITVPVLAFFPSLDLPKPLPENEQKRTATLEFNAATRAYVDRWKKNMQTAPGGVRIVELRGANHYLFLSNADEVIRELKAFLAGLR